MTSTQEGEEPSKQVSNVQTKTTQIHSNNIEFYTQRTKFVNTQETHQHQKALLSVGVYVRPSTICINLRFANIFGRLPFFCQHFTHMTRTGYLQLKREQTHSLDCP